MTISIETILKTARQRLAGSSQAVLETEILLAHALDSSRSFLYAHPELVLSHDRIRKFEALLQKRLAGTPIAYLTGKREFWSLPLEVTPDTLIPRPETELLVETALESIPLESPCRVVDLGTGSGAIALAIASERPAAEVVAVDISEEALMVARANAARLEIGNVRFVKGNWYSQLEGDFDIIVSNPPYIMADDEHLDLGDVRFEPRRALAAGPDGLDSIREIIAGCQSALGKNGYLLLEHGYNQGVAVRELLLGAGMQNIKTLQDLELRDRVSIAQYIAQSGD